MGRPERKKARIAWVLAGKVFVQERGLCHVQWCPVVYANPDALQMPSAETRLRSRPCSRFGTKGNEGDEELLIFGPFVSFADFSRDWAGLRWSEMTSTRLIEGLRTKRLGVKPLHRNGNIRLWMIA